MRDAGAVPLPDQVDHHVKGGGRAARGQAVAVDDETVGDDGDGGVGGGEILKVLPMGGGAVAVQEPGAGEEPGARVECGQRADAGGEAGEAGRERAGGQVAGLKTGNGDEEVGAGGGREVAHDGEREAAGQRDGIGHRGDDGPADRLAPQMAVGAAQRVERGGDRQQRCLRQDEEGDGQVWHCDFPCTGCV